MYSLSFESLLSLIVRIWKLFFRSVGTYFSCKLLCQQRKIVLPLSRNKFLLSNGASLVGKAGFSLKHEYLWHIFQQSKTKIKKEYLIPRNGKGLLIYFCLSFLLKIESRGRIILLKKIITTSGIDFLASENHFFLLFSDITVTETNSSFRLVETYFL